jgi:hypothetical protein
LGVVVDVSGVVVDGEFGVLGVGLTAPGGLLVPLGGGVVVEPAAPLVVSLPVVELELGAVVEALAVPPVEAPDHQSCEARCFGEAFR